MVVPVPRETQRSTTQADAAEADEHPKSRSFSRREIYDLAWSKPLDALALDLGVSDRGLSKLCARHSIPLPPQGYWLLKVKPARPALPTLRRKQARIVFQAKPLVPPQYKLLVEARRTPLADPPGYISAAKAHRWIRATVSALRRPGQDPHLAIATGDGLCGVECRKVDVYRAVRLLDGLARAVEARGMVLRPVGDYLRVELQGTAADVHLYGQHDGYFGLWILAHGGRRRTWRDTDEMLIERLLPRIVIGFEAVLRDMIAHDEALRVVMAERDAIRRAAEQEAQRRLAYLRSDLDRMAASPTAMQDAREWLETSRALLPPALADLIEAALHYAAARAGAEPIA